MASRECDHVSTAHGPPASKSAHLLSVLNSPIGCIYATILMLSNPTSIKVDQSSLFKKKKAARWSIRRNFAKNEWLVSIIFYFSWQYLRAFLIFVFISLYKFCCWPIVVTWRSLILHRHNIPLNVRSCRHTRMARETRDDFIAIIRLTLSPHLILSACDQMLLQERVLRCPSLIWFKFRYAVDHQKLRDTCCFLATCFYVQGLRHFSFCA